MKEQREPWELTGEELNKVFDSAFDEPLYLDHKPTPDDLITHRLKAVAQAAKKKFWDWGEYLCDDAHSSGFHRRRFDCPKCMSDLKAKLEGK